jgi:hypothetical protein
MAAGDPGAQIFRFEVRGTRFEEKPFGGLFLSSFTFHLVLKRSQVEILAERRSGDKGPFPDGH